jgi:hypothetical protein|tara:strand:+ start:5301 stop:5963 length:663 start_codon:yes stop_codon:yes gene_type:complete
MMKLKNEDKFHRMMKDYLRLSSKSFAEAMNYKAYMIALVALKKTKAKTAKAVEKWWWTDRFSTRGKHKAKFGNSKGTALVPKLASVWGGLNRGNSRSELEAEIKDIANRRKKGVGFLRSGWLPAIRALAQHTGGKVKKAPKTVKMRKPYGRAKKAKKARGLKALATIENYTGKHSESSAEALLKYGKPALEIAIQTEARETVKYLARKLNKDADKLWRMY